jgi:hypothetical protein
MKRHVALITLGLVCSAVSIGLLTPKPTRAAQTCSVGTLIGDYVGNLSGTTASTGPVALQALVQFAGDGTATSPVATLMTQTAGPITFTANITYTLNSDCTGTLTVVRSTGQTTHYVIAVAKEESEINLLAVDPGSVVTGTFKKSL